MDRHRDELGGADLAESGRHDPSGFNRPSSAILGPEDSRWLTLYVGAAFLYIIALRRIPLSVALPCTAASYIGAIFIGHFLYNETVTLIHLTAVAFIGCGVILLAFSAK